MRKLMNIQLFATTIPVQLTPDNTFHYTPTDLANEENFGKLLEPGLRKVFFESYDELPEQFPKIYNVEKSEKAREQDYGLGAFGDWEKRASQFDTVDYKKLSPGLERTYIHDAFTQGFAITREMYDDDQYRVMNRMAAANARSGRQKVERDAMLPLINGFDALKPIYDGKALFAKDHPLLDSVKLGDNLATGPLTDENLKAAIQKMRQVPDEAGNLVQFKATRLIIPPALEDAAIRIIGSDRISAGNLNDTNKFLNSYGIEVVVLDYLGEAGGGSDTHWFLQDASRHELNFFWRVRPEFKWDESFDNLIQKYRGYMRYSYGVSDWRGLIGSDGKPVGP